VPLAVDKKRGAEKHRDLPKSPLVTIGSLVPSVGTKSISKCFGSDRWGRWPRCSARIFYRGHVAA
jgi:hypothetical protein